MFPYTVVLTFRGASNGRLCTLSGGSGPWAHAPPDPPWSVSPENLCLHHSIPETALNTAPEKSEKAMSISLLFPQSQFPFRLRSLVANISFLLIPVLPIIYLKHSP